MFRALLVAALLTSSVHAEELYIASWNVENLFDTKDDPLVEGDEEFTPSGAKKYTQERFNTRLTNLARVIKDMNSGRGPDVLGLAEIENRFAVECLVSRLTSLKRDYQIIHQDSPSRRGIDCAIIYDARRLKAAAARFITIPVPPERRTRDTVEAELDVAGKRLFVFMVHWPARSNPEADRITAARTLRARLDALLAKDALADIIVMGDFNDYPDNKSLRDELRAGPDPSKLTNGSFYNTMTPIHKAGKGTYVFQNRWEIIDHMLISPGLLNGQDFRWRDQSTAPVMFPYQIFTPSKTMFIPRPNRAFSGDLFHKSGISDHLPLGCVLDY